MAKTTNTVIFQNAVIDLKDRTITEFKKDSTESHSLDEVLREWDGIGGITLSIKRDGQKQFKAGDTD